MNIQMINTDKREDRKLFSQFPFDLYHGNPFWTPPFPGEIRLAMNRQSHPFYKHSTADFFIAHSGNDVLGRLAVLKNENYCHFHNQQIAFVYYLEMIDDSLVARSLLATAAEWAKAHNADTLLIGKGLLRSNGQGIHVKGFDLPPAMGIAYQFPYYDHLIKENGFEKETDYFSGILEHRIDPKVHQVAEKVKQRSHFWIKNFSSTKEMEKWIPLVDKVHHEAFANNPGFYPSTPEEFTLLCKNIISVAVPAYTKLIMYEEEVAGFILAYPNLGRALRATRGSGSLPSMLQLLYEKKHSHWIDMNGVGLLPKYQGLGANALLYSEVEKTIVAAGITHAEIIQVDERNFRSYSDMNTMGVEWKKTHRTYQKKI